MLDFLQFPLGNNNFTREQLTLHRSDVLEEMNTAPFETVQFTVFRGSSKCRPAEDVKYGPSVTEVTHWKLAVGPLQKDRLVIIMV